MLRRERKAGRKIVERCGAIMAPFPGATDIPVGNSYCPGRGTEHDQHDG